MANKGARVPAPKRLCLWPLTLRPLALDPRSGPGEEGAESKPRWVAWGQPSALGRLGPVSPTPRGLPTGVQDPGGPCCPAGCV